jgi:hypothetical protein
MWPRRALQPWRRIRQDPRHDLLRHLLPAWVIRLGKRGSADGHKKTFQQSFPRPTPGTATEVPLQGGDLPRGQLAILVKDQPPLGRFAAAP